MHGLANVRRVLWSTSCVFCMKDLRFAPTVRDIPFRLYFRRPQPCLFCPSHNDFMTFDLFAILGNHVIVVAHEYTEKKD